jgi:hypothetical protein
MEGIVMEWRARDAPLMPDAVAATGAALAGLARATRRRIEAGHSLLATGNDDWLIVLGPTESLPWADGAHYLAFEGGVLLPTTLAPSIPPSMLTTTTHQAELKAFLPGVILLSSRPSGPADPQLLSSVGQSTT